jgi:hypothetical protein
MNEADTADIVKRIVGTWPMSPKGYLWTEALHDLDYGPALATYVQLRDETDEQRISIARFKQAYRGIDGTGNTGRRHPHDHDTAGPPISFDEYIALLTAKAHAGDTDAAELLDVWAQNLARTPKGNHL